jgi:uncharacterized protein (DUF433 family)
MAVVPRLTRITRDYRTMGGKPCIRGMRVTVGTIVGLFAQDLSEALAYAAWRAMEVDVEIGGP